MADRVSVSIVIGGDLAAADRDALIACVNDERLSTEWDGPAFDAGQLVAGEPLRLYSHEVAWGKLDDLTAFCVARSLPFAHRSGGYFGAYGPELVVFTGRDEPRSFAADEEEQPVLCRAEVERLGDYAAVMAYFDAADFVVPPLIIGP